MKIYKCVGCGQHYGSIENALDCDCGRGEAVSVEVVNTIAETVREATDGNLA